MIQEPITDKMRRVYLHVALDTRSQVTGGTPVARSYAGEKIDLAFSAQYEHELLGHLDPTRREMYYRRMRETK